MRDGLSLTALAAMASAQTSEVFLWLATVTAPSLEQPLRFVNNTEPITSRSNLFGAFNFSAVFPSASSDKPGRATLTVDNVNQQFSQILRKQGNQAKVLLELIVASEPDTVLVSLPELEWKNLKAPSPSRVQGDLSRSNILDAQTPAYRYTPETAPGMF